MIYNVPYFQPVSPDTCWYAAAQMIFAFRGEQIPLPSGPNKSLPSDPQAFADLARQLGMLPVPTQSYPYTPQTLEAILSQYGPLWVPIFSFELPNAPGTWAGHVVVLIGVENDTVCFNNPASRGPSNRGYRIRTIQEFNGVVVPYRPMLYLPKRSGPPDRRIIIKPRDTLSDIAKREYGQWQLWPLIYDRNKNRVGADPNRIYPGMELLLAPLQRYSPREIHEARQRAGSWKFCGP
jgi:hypothetical protein